MPKNPKHYVDIRITFTKEQDEFDEDYEYFRPKYSYQVESTLPQGAADSIAESWAQMDHYILLSPDLIINGLCDDGKLDLRR